MHFYSPFGSLLDSSWFIPSIVVDCLQELTLPSYLHFLESTTEPYGRPKFPASCVPSQPCSSPSHYFVSALITRNTFNPGPLMSHLAGTQVGDSHYASRLSLQYRHSQPQPGKNLLTGVPTSTSDSFTGNPILDSELAVLSLSLHIIIFYLAAIYIQNPFFPPKFQSPMDPTSICEWDTLSSFLKSLFAFSPTLPPLFSATH